MPHNGRGRFDRALLTRKKKGRIYVWSLIGVISVSVIPLVSAQFSRFLVRINLACCSRVLTPCNWNPAEMDLVFLGTGLARSQDEDPVRVGLLGGIPGPGILF